MTQLVIAGSIIDVEENINYNFQVADIAEIKASKSTYTSSFKIPRTSEVVKLMDGLGVPADTSRKPYIILNVDVLDDYTPILHNGVLLFNKTEALYYNVAVISGTFDFFTEVGDTKISDLDIGDIIHDKTTDKVNEALLGQHVYKYFFAHFGGLERWIFNNANTINIDYMIPAVPASYLWDKIFEKFPRFTYSGDVFSSDDFNTLNVTFPYPPFSQIGQEQRELFTGMQQFLQSFGDGVPITGYENWSTIDNTGTGLTVVNNWQYQAVENGVYRLNIVNFTGFALYGAVNDLPLLLHIEVNGVVRQSVHSTLEGTIENVAELLLDLTVGDIVNFRILRNEERPSESCIVQIDLFTIETFKVVAVQEDLDKIFKIKATDFIKEIMWRYALIAFVDGNHIEFVSLGDIINNSEAIDWSDKYIERIDETYNIQYAKNNYLRHEYVIDGDEYFDRNIIVDNANLEATKDIIQSKFYAPSLNQPDYSTHPSVLPLPLRTYETFTGSGLEMTDFDTEERNFFVRTEQVTVPYRIGSRSMGDVLDVSTPTPVYREDFSTLQFLTNPYYDVLSKILDDTRVHRISLLLTSIDVNQLDFKKVYYFQQEGAFYMLNKLQYKKGDEAKGEFIKIRR